MTAGGKISVLVVDGNYSALHELGFPLPALAAIQAVGTGLLGHKAVYFRDVCELFWPSSPGQTQLSSALKISKSKKRIRHKRRNKSRLNSPVENSHTEVVPQCLLKFRISLLPLNLMFLFQMDLHIVVSRPFLI